MASQLSTATTSAQMVDAARRLVDLQAPALLNKLYALKTQLLLLPQRDTYLKDSEWNKLRSKLEKKFPLVPEIEKISGHELFLARKADIQQELAGCYQICARVAQFFAKSREVLQNIPKMVFELRLKRNHPISLLWIKLFVLYNKMHYFVALIPELFVVIPFYCAACKYNGAEISPQRLQELQLLLADSDQFQQRLFDFSLPMRGTVSMLFGEIRDVVFLAIFEQSLRDQRIFNVANDGTQMGLPAERAVNANTELSLYSELLNAELYFEFVGYAVLANPTLLSEELHSRLFSEISSCRCVLSIHRDLRLNLFVELEKTVQLIDRAAAKQQHLLATAPANIGAGSNQESTAAAKSAISSNMQTKIAKYLKLTARSALSGAAVRMRSRRVILANELQSNLQLLRACPALIAPKLPMFLALAGLLRSEVLAFLRHFSSFPVRKDCKNHYDASSFSVASEELSLCLHLLASLAGAVNSSERELIDYYLEFLFRTDCDLLQSFEPLFQSSIVSMSLQQLFNKIVTIVESLHMYHHENTDEIERLSISLRDHHSQFVLLASHLSLAPMVNAHASALEKCLRMLSLSCEFHASLVCDRERSRMVAEHVLPSDAIFFRDEYLLCYSRALRGHSFSPAISSCGAFARNREINRHAVHYLQLLEHSLCNLSPLEVDNTRDENNKESANGKAESKDKEREKRKEKEMLRERELEMHDLGDMAISLSNEMVSRLVDSVLLDIDALVALHLSLNAQHHALQVLNGHNSANNTVTQASTQSGANGNGVGFTPGMESEFWATEQMRESMIVHERLQNLLLGVSLNLPQKLQVYTREYNVSQFLCESIVVHLRQRMLSIFGVLSSAGQGSEAQADSGNGSRLYRFSRSLTKWKLTLQSLIQVAELLPEFVATTAVRQLVLEQLSLTEACAPFGCAVTLGGAPSASVHVREAVLGHVSAWLSRIVDALASQTPASPEVYSMSDTPSTVRRGAIVIYSPERDAFICLSRVRALRSQPVTHGIQANVSLSASFSADDVQDSSSTMFVEQFVSYNELTALAKIVGLQGIRALEAELLVAAVDELTQLRHLLQVNARQLSGFAANLTRTVADVVNILQMEKMLQLLKSIEIRLWFRRMLLAAIGNVCADIDSDISRSIQSFFANLQPWADSSVGAFAQCFALGSYFHSRGSSARLREKEQQRDIGLFVSVFELIKTKWSFGEVLALYRLLPAFGAAALVSPSLFDNQSYFDVLLQGFDRNEHLVQQGIASLLVLAHNLLIASLMSHATKDRMASDSLMQLPSLFDAIFEAQSKDAIAAERPLSSPRSSYGQPNDDEISALLGRLHIDDADVLDANLTASTLTLLPTTQQPHSQSHRQGSVASSTGRAPSVLGKSSVGPTPSPVPPPERVSILRGSSQHDCWKYVQRYFQLCMRALHTARLSEHAATYEMPSTAIAVHMAAIAEQRRPAGLPVALLQALMPSSILHCERMDLVLGRQRESDAYDPLRFVSKALDREGKAEEKPN